MTQSRLESMARGTQGAELSVKEMETVGVGGCQGRGHSDDMGVTSWGSRNNMKSLDCNKEQPDSAATRIRTLTPCIGRLSPKHWGPGSRPAHVSHHDAFSSQSICFYLPREARTVY